MESSPSRSWFTSRRIAGSCFWTKLSRSSMSRLVMGDAYTRYRVSIAFRGIVEFPIPSIDICEPIPRHLPC